MPKVARSGDLGCQKIAAPGMPGANPFSIEARVAFLGMGVIS